MIATNKRFCAGYFVSLKQGSYMYASTVTDDSHMHKIFSIPNLTIICIKLITRNNKNFTITNLFKMKYHFCITNCFKKPSKIAPNLGRLTGRLRKHSGVIFLPKCINLLSFSAEYVICAFHRNTELLLQSIGNIIRDFKEA